MLVHPGYFFDFARRGVSRAEPAARRRDVFDEAVVGCCRSPQGALADDAARRASCCRCSRAASTDELGHRRACRSRAARRSGWRRGGFDRLMLLPLGTMPAGETSPYSAMSTMAIDPIYIALDDGRRLRARRRRARAVGRASREDLDARPRAIGRRLRRASAARRTRRSSSRSTRFSTRRMGRSSRRAPPRSRRTSRASAGGSTTTRSFSALSRCDVERALAGLAGAAARSRPARARRGPAAACARRPAASVPGSGSPRRSGSRRARPRARAGVSRHRRSAVRRRAPTARTCGRARTSSCSTSRLGVPPDAFSADRAGLGAADLSMGRHRRDRLRLDAPARAPHGGALRRHPRRSPRSGSIAPTDVRRRARRSSRRRDEADAASRRARRSCGILRRERRCDSSPRISASSRTSCARRSRGSACPAARCCAGSAHWHAPGQPFIDPAIVSAGVGGDDRHARHRAARGLVGRGCRATSAPALLTLPELRRRRRSADPTQPWNDGAARCAPRARLSRGIVTTLFLPDAGPVRLARSHQHARARSATTTGRGVCRGRSIGCDERARGRERARFSHAVLAGATARYGRTTLALLSALNH